MSVDFNKVIKTKMVKCRVCNEVKVAYCIGLYRNGKDYKYVDENNKRFNGRTCANCHVSKMKIYKQLKKYKVKAEDNGQTDNNQ